MGPIKMTQLMCIFMILDHISEACCNPSVKLDCGVWFNCDPLPSNGSVLVTPAIANLKPIVKAKYFTDPHFPISENIDAIIKAILRMRVAWEFLGMRDDLNNEEEEIAVINEALCGSENDYVDDAEEKFDEICNLAEDEKSATEYKFCFGEKDAMVGFWDRSTMAAVNEMFENLGANSNELMEKKRNFYCYAKDKKIDVLCPPESNAIEEQVNEERQFYEDNVENYIKRKIAGEYINVPKYLKNTKGDRAVTTTACALGVQNEELFKYYMKTYCEKPKKF